MLFMHTIKYWLLLVYAVTLAMKTKMIMKIKMMTGLRVGWFVGYRVGWFVGLRVERVGRFVG